MPDSLKTAVLFNTDPMIRKGLEILLSDLHISVISAGNITDLSNMLAATSVTPDLLIFPLLLDNQKPSISFIRALRQQYGHSVPAIILNEDTPMHELLLSDSNLIVLPDLIKPTTLREKILESISSLKH